MISGMDRTKSRREQTNAALTVHGMNRTKSRRGQTNEALTVHCLLTIHGPNLT